jgi:hypothetical protein
VIVRHDYLRAFFLTSYLRPLFADHSQGEKTMIVQEKTHDLDR